MRVLLNKAVHFCPKPVSSYSLMLCFLFKTIPLTTNIWLQKYFDTLQVIWWLFVVCYGG